MSGDCRCELECTATVALMQQGYSTAFQRCSGKHEYGRRQASTASRRNKGQTYMDTGIQALQANTKSSAPMLQFAGDYM